MGGDACHGADFFHRGCECIGALSESTGAGAGNECAVACSADDASHNRAGCERASREDAAGIGAVLNLRRRFRKSHYRTGDAAYIALACAGHSGGDVAGD